MEPSAVISRRPSQPAPQPRGAGAGKRIAVVMIGLAAVARLPASSRTQQHAIMFAIALGAAAGLARDSQASSRARLVAWDKRQQQRHLRTVKAQAKRLADGVTG
ncbi:MAG TPA: hypothetical protein VLW50_31960 [Streptosporangiaceae bacterium]|nr:hypothetical protein [Streptosporangiaceae bacterium]